MRRDSNHNSQLVIGVGVGYKEQDHVKLMTNGFCMNFGYLYK